ncbi:hypothetical protein PRIPAC_91631 [Pristionchus pacificus]|uniref:Uncharacterized protein n=1 Tax=Pristionchus pacificus TaxID=54126 RepID=A0A2A6CIH4_PRIPA|nr:hypothetical protein PRIPAC_91631 [Pristionchus pacificus]|eukprot:PDM77878.1 hypothetical protein PRIPAC_34745 [Pristionchus pacificus]
MEVINAVAATGIVSLILYEAYKLLAGAYRGLTEIKALRRSKKIRILIAGAIDGLRAGIAREFRDRAESLEASKRIPGGTLHKFKVDFDEFSLVELTGVPKECCDNNESFDVSNLKFK